MTSPTPQDGEGLDRCVLADDGVRCARREPEHRARMHGGLGVPLVPLVAAVAPDIAAQVRRQCAEELRADLAAGGSGWDLTERLHARANTWTGQ